MSENRRDLSRIPRHLFAAILAIALVCAPAVASAAMLTITSNLDLYSNHTGNILVNANNVTITCHNGASISYSSGGTSANCNGSRCGIAINGRSNITIRDCNVSGAFTNGIWANNVNGLYIYSSQTQGAVSDGIRMEGGTQNVLLSAVDSMWNSGGGIVFRDVIAAYVYYTWGWENGVDGFDDGASGTTGSTGIEFDGASSTVNCRAFGNGANGYEVDSAASNHVFYPGTEASGNGKHGFSLDASSLLTLMEVRSYDHYDADASNDGGNGIRLQSVTNSLVEDSDFTGNECDIYRTGSTTTTWTNNSHSSECNANNI
jgi:hypothetical protein